MNTETLLREALQELVIAQERYWAKEPIGGDLQRNKAMVKARAALASLHDANLELHVLKKSALLDEADARRYRWLRNHMDWGGWYWDGSNNMLHGEELDTKIDAAMSQDPLAAHPLVRGEAS